MKWAVILFLAGAALAFLASSILYAFAPAAGVIAVAPLFHLDPAVARAPEALTAMARPDGRGLRLLLGAVWLAVATLGVRVIAIGWADATGRRVAGPAALPSPFAAPWATGLALAAGALWPWVGQYAGRAPALALVALMAGAAIWAAIQRRQRRAPGAVLTGTVEFFAGWGTVALYSSFAALLILDLGVSTALAAVVSVLLLMATAVEVQLRLGNTVAYGAAVIWALMGIAAATMQTDLTVATAAVIAIAALAAVLVRVLS